MKKNAIYILDAYARDLIYGPEERADIASLVSMEAQARTRQTILDDPRILEDIEIVFSGWGGPRIDEAFLEKAPRLEYVFYGAGSVRPVVTDEIWRKGIRISSAYAANAVPVSEYTLAMIILCLKQAFRSRQALSASRQFVPQYLVVPEPDKPLMSGSYGARVGIVSLGMVGRRVCFLLKNHDVRVLGFDPYISEPDAETAGVERLCSLEEIFAESDAVSLHAPLTGETEGMIGYSHFMSMKRNASFINTSRGAVVDQEGMIRALRERPDIQAVLDVTNPEPCPPDSPLFDLPNVLLTPHIAGSLGNECRRMGRYMADECRRYLNGEALQWEITRERLAVMA